MTKINFSAENESCKPKKQHQDQQPGQENLMQPKPIHIHNCYQSANKLKEKVAIITGGGIGEAVVYHFSREGAKIVYVFLNETEDAKKVNQYLEKQGNPFLSIKGDLSEQDFCGEVVNKTLKKFGRINFLVNNIAQQYPCDNFQNISPAQLKLTFETNFFSYFYMAQAVVKYMEAGDAIINTTSVTAYRGSAHLIDYASTKGAIVSFTRSLAKSLMKTGIRVNGVAPGPVWTPLIPASFDKEIVEGFGENSPMGAPAQPADIAPAYVYLASQDSRFMSGQVLHINSGEIVNG